MIGDNTQTALLQSAIDMRSIVLDKKGKRNIDNIDLVSPIDITNYFKLTELFIVFTFARLSAFYDNKM